MEIEVPDLTEDFPAAIEQATVLLSDVTQELEDVRRQKRNLKIEFKMEARESDASNRTERKAYVKDKKEKSDLYQDLLGRIESLTRKQAHLKGRLKRLEGEFEVRKQDLNAVV
jgi:predicted  nucleic acid-binding Zn-ribbon protein